MTQSKLQELSEQLTRWRGANRRRGRLPEEFWREAVAVARQEGLYRTAKALPVGWRQLKKRMKEQEPAFVEVKATPAARGPLLELETRQGKVRLEVGGMGAEEIARLVRALGA